MCDSNQKQIEAYFENLKDQDDLDELYKHPMVNWKGPQNPGEDNPYYTEQIAKKLLNDTNRQVYINCLQNLSSDRGQAYFPDSHDGVTDKETNRQEEIFAKSLLGHKIDHLGRVIDYQLPLKGAQSDNYGKVDLVSVYSGNGKNEAAAYLIELKMVDPEQKETLLRAALELETYWAVMDHDKFRKELGDKIDQRYGDYEEHALNDFPQDDLPIKKAVLFATNGNQPRELENSDAYPNVMDLLQELNIQVVTMPKVYPAEMHLDS
ncbi:MAG: hypothetical protein ACQETE_02605 [Bacteroidota bacterium]